MPGSGTPRRVTTADVAKEAGVSRATVGFVLNNSQPISEGTRARVLEAAARLGYRRNLAATVLASGRSKIILLVLPEWPVEFTMQRSLEEASRALDDAGYSLVTQAHSSARTARPLWESLSPDVVIGWGSFSAEDVASMKAAGITRIIPHPDQPTALDEAPGVREGVVLQIDHLLDLGHRKIVYAVTGEPRMAELVRSRTSAAEQAVAERGAELVQTRAIRLADEANVQIVRDFMAAGVTAIAAFNDDVAAAVAGAALRAGIRVPEELAVIGHDDSPVASLFRPSLSSIRMDPERAGRLLAEVALREAEGRPVSKAASELDLRLVVRESTGG